MDFLNTIGILAGILTTLSFLPQVLKVWSNKSAKDISLGWLLTFSTGVLLWIFYGLHIGSFPVLISNIATVLLVLLILIFKIRFRKNN
jgi:MtN3 and saliva related transmembrane protein